jgi:cytidylate kinase
VDSIRAASERGAAQKEERKMPSVVISADTPGGGKAIAVEAAASLGGRHVGAGFLAEAAEKCDVPMDDLTRLLDPLQSRWRPLPRKQRGVLSKLKEQVVALFLEDDLVCEGFYAHLFLARVPHILTARVLVDVDGRVSKLAAEKQISAKRARSIVDKEDKRQRRWSEQLFGVNEADISLYDLLIPLGEVGEERAAGLITTRVAARQFKPTTYSRRLVEDQLLAARLEAAMVEKFPKVEVAVNDGDAVLRYPGGAAGWRKAAEEMKSIASKVDGVGSVQVHKGRSSIAPG